MSDEKLLESLIVTYAEYRNDNDGGDSDTMLSWVDCLYETFRDYEDELVKYKRNN